MKRILSAGLLVLAATAWAADGGKAAGKSKKAEAAEPPKAESVEPPEVIKFEKTGKLAPVKFPHEAHAQKNACKDCHEGEKPLFEQKRSTEGLKMADMYAGKSCGACHDGKDHGKNKKVFAAKTACMKCHKK